MSLSKVNVLEVISQPHIITCETNITVRPAQTVVLSSTATGHIRKKSCAWGRHRVMHYSVEQYMFYLYDTNLCVCYSPSALVMFPGG